MTTTFKVATTTVFQPSNVNQANDPSAANNSRTRVAPEASSTDATRKDTAALSVPSVLSASSALSASALDASRSARVESLRQSIAAGTYFVPAHDVASAIIHSLL